MAARIKNNKDFSAAMAVVFAAVLLYSAWGYTVLHSTAQAEQTSPTQLAQR